jgi:hypothetical protein
VKLPELAELGRIRPLAVLPRRLEDRGQPLELGMAEEDAQLVAELSLADVLVSIPVRSECILGVVHMERAEPVEPDSLVELEEDCVENGFVGDVDSGDPQVAGVEADAESGMTVEAVEDDRELGDGAAHRAARSGRVLEEDPRIRALTALERAAEGADDAIETTLEAGAQVRADVEDDPVRLDRAGDLDRVQESVDRLFVDVLLGSGQIDEVDRVTKNCLDPGLLTALLETLDVVGVVIRRPPRARALGEDLHRLTAPELLHAVDRLVNAAGCGHVGAEKHRTTIALCP